ncbi:heterokaryon incompatibility protein-domain-containing protein [Cladorrhinum sp. PSN259]|nr:heterokaryon incompatibility protein-domain-containing protein [Cladorrhinum sp. PSN259]
MSVASHPASRVAFHALSYFWGDSPDCVAIWLESGGEADRSKGLFAISRTVERAIRRIRTLEAPLRIWIDAVCINQEDLEERRQQVTLMGQIYSCAEMVHVWLDEEIHGLEEALRLIRDIYNCNHRLCPGGEECRCSGTSHTLSAKELDEITRENDPSLSLGFVRHVFDRHRSTKFFDSSAVEASGGEEDARFDIFMQTFFHHPWFQRVWVVQEAILGPKTTVHSASEAIDWQEILMVNEIISSSKFVAGATFLRTRNSMPSIWKKLAQVQPVGEARVKNEEVVAPPHRRSGREPLTILEVFLAALDMKATDPRDKLYALLPFGQETCAADKNPSMLLPDYGKPLTEVMADFTRWWILEYRSLDVLSLVHRQPTRAWRRTLCDADPRVTASTPRPTWALGTEGYAQWSGMTLCEQFPTFLAAGDTSPDEDLLRPDNPLELVLRGCIVGKIVALDHPPLELVCPYLGSTDIVTQLATVFHRMFDPSGRTGVWLLHGNNYDLEAEDPVDLQQRFDAHVEAHFAYASAPEQSQHVLRPRTTSAGISTTPSYERYLADDLPACIEKCFFVTLDGRHGLCPWNAKEGDLITILHGGSVPYLLRPVGCGSETKGQKYELVGECFVVGAMGGEMVVNEAREYGV